MAENFREHVCPNCGAPLGIPEKHERFFKCQFCGTILEDQASKEEQQTGVFKIKISQQEISAARASQVPVYSAPPVRPTAPVRVSSSGNRIGCIITIAVLLLVGGILAVSLLPALIATGSVVEVFQEVGIQPPESLDTSGLGGITLYGFGNAALLPSDNDTLPDFTGVGYGAESKNYLVYVDLETAPALRWLNEISGDEVSYVYNVFLTDGPRLFYSYGDKVAAFNRQQGSLIWEATLSDKIQHNICPGCFQLFGDKIASLGADGTLQVWDAATGALSWQVRMQATPRQIVNMGGNPAVLDDIDDQVRLRVFNIADGSIVQEIFAACPSYPFPDSPQEIGIYDYIHPVNSGGVVFFGGFFEPGCAIRWLPGADEPAWMAEYDSNILARIQPENILQTQDTLFVANEKGAYALDMASGAFTTLIEDTANEYDFYPIDTRDGVLLLRVDVTRGTRHWEIWGLDAQLGNIKWTYRPDAEDFIDPDNISSSIFGDGGWTAGMTSDGLTVAQVLVDPVRLNLQTISLQSGTSSSPVTVSLPDSDTSLSFTVLGWRNNTLWLLEDIVRPTIMIVDVTTGQEIATWP